MWKNYPVSVMTLTMKKVKVLMYRLTAKHISDAAVAVFISSFFFYSHREKPTQNYAQRAVATAVKER